MGRDVINALIDSIFESLREDLTQQFLSLPCEIKKDILHSIQEVLASSPDGSNLLARSEEPILISPQKKSQVLRDGRSLRTTLEVVQRESSSLSRYSLRRGGLYGESPRRNTSIGVRITNESTGATPYAYVAGDQAQPAPQIVCKLFPG